MSHESALIRRSSAACLIVICQHCRNPLNNAQFLLTFAIGKTEDEKCLSLKRSLLDQLLEHHQESESVRLINGNLGLIKNLIQYLGTNIDEIHSIGTNANRNLDELPLTRRNLIEVCREGG